MKDPFDERRKSSRIYRNFIISYHEKGKPALGGNVSQVNDVSKGGVNFSSTYALKEGAVITIDLKTPFLADSVCLDGVVLSCKEKIPELIYEIRLKFKEVPKDAEDVLKKIEAYSKDFDA